MIVCAAANPSVDRLFEVERLRPGQRAPPRAVRAGGRRQRAERRPGRRDPGRGGAGRRDPGRACRPVARAGELERTGISARGGLGGRRVAVVALGRRPRGGGHDRVLRARRRDDGTRPGSEFVDAAAAVSARGRLDERSRDRCRPAPRPTATSCCDSACPSAADTVEGDRPRSDGLVKLNAGEAGQVTGVATGTAERGALPRRSSLHSGGGAGAVTRGPAGAVLVLAGRRRPSPGRWTRPGAYPVGSGDSFLAGLVVARAAGADWDDALAAGARGRRGERGRARGGLLLARSTPSGWPSAGDRHAASDAERRCRRRTRGRRRGRSRAAATCPAPAALRARARRDRPTALGDRDRRGGGAPATDPCTITSLPSGSTTRRQIEAPGGGRRRPPGQEPLGAHAQHDLAVGARRAYGMRDRAGRKDARADDPRHRGSSAGCR